MARQHYTPPYMRRTPRAFSPVEETLPKVEELPVTPVLAPEVPVLAPEVSAEVPAEEAVSIPKPPVPVFMRHAVTAKVEDKVEKIEAKIEAQVEKTEAKVEAVVKTSKKKKK